MESMAESAYRPGGAVALTMMEVVLQKFVLHRFLTFSHLKQLSKVTNLDGLSSIFVAVLPKVSFACA